MALFARHPSITCLWRPFPWLLVTLTVLLMACAVRPSASSPAHPTLGAKNTIFVTSNGWHSSIVIARADLPYGRIPEVEDFPHARFLEFGWGDGEYYPAKDPTIAMTLRAAWKKGNRRRPPTIAQRPGRSCSTETDQLAGVVGIR